MSSLVYEDRMQKMRVVMRIHILRCTEMSNGNFKCGASIQQPDEAWVSYVHNKLETLKQRRAENAANESVNTK
jgi:hypothetical protein